MGSYVPRAWILVLRKLPLLFLAGDMHSLAIFFLLKRFRSYSLAPSGFTERTYMYLLVGYMVSRFLGMVTYSFFYMA